jgi:hypothetical protein
MHIAVVDIGKPGKSFGWSMFGPRPSEGNNIDSCVEALAAALKGGALALGFEAPMFVPLRQVPSALLAARNGECGVGIPSRPFSAGAGPTALVTGLVVVPYILSGLRDAAPDAVATLDWHAPLSNPGQLLLFEAFVTNQKKSNDSRHVEDARLAVEAFRHRIAAPERFDSSVVEEHCFNLLGAMMLRTNWASDPRILSQACLVVRA